MDVTLEVQGLKKIQRNAEQVASEIAKSGKLVARAAVVLERQIKMNATGRPGPRIQSARLRASIVPEVINPTLARVGTNVHYASFVEFGHMQHVGQFVPPLRKRLVADRAPAYPFFQPAIEQTKGQIQDVIVTFGNELGTEWAK